MSTLRFLLSLVAIGQLTLAPTYGCILAATLDHCENARNERHYDFRLNHSSSGEVILTGVDQLAACEYLDVPIHVDVIPAGVLEDRNFSSSVLTIRRDCDDTESTLRVSKESFRGATWVRELVFDVVGATLEPNLFSELKGLRVLRFRLERPVQPPDGVFAGLTILERLVLDFRADEIGNGTFQGVGQTLRELELRMEALERIRPGAFSSLRALERLTFGRNDIATLPDGAWAWLERLQRLEFRASKLPELRKGALTGLSHLRDLRLVHREGKRLRRIESGALEAVPELRLLRLAGHNLTRIEAGAFVPLEKLEALDLWTDQPLSVDPGAFRGLPKLRLLAIRQEALGSQVEKDHPELSKIRVLHRRHSFCDVIGDCRS